MIKSTLFTALFLCLLTTNALAQFGRSRVESTLNWHTDTAAALAEAKKTGKPIIAVFR